MTVAATVARGCSPVLPEDSVTQPLLDLMLDVRGSSGGGDAPSTGWVQGGMWEGCPHPA